MKNVFFLIIVLLLFSCGKNADNERVVLEENTSVPPYDTIAVDSLSPGATSVDIVRKIKIASQQFQDSLKLAKAKNEEEKLVKKMQEDLLIAEKKAAASKKKTETEKEKIPETKRETTTNP